MMLVPGLYRDQGVVLRTIKLGEADRIVTIFTQAHGKVRAVAKGVRRTQSKFGSRLEPTTHVAVQLYAGRELDVVTQCETIESNHALRERYGLLTHAVPMLEAVDHLTEEREANPAIYRMLTGALRTLAELRNPIVTPAFFWKLLALEGYQPRLDGCARCDASPPLVSFDLEEGGGLCERCAIGGGRRLSPEAFALLGLILGGGLQSALAAEPGPAAHDVERLGLMAIEHFLERRLKSAVLL
jgi:DNA repair protein RecO (recombination protein O)